MEYLYDCISELNKPISSNNRWKELNKLIFLTTFKKEFEFLIKNSSSAI